MLCEEVSIVVRLPGSLGEHGMANPCGDAAPCEVAMETNWVTQTQTGNPLEEAKRKGLCTGPLKSLIWSPRIILGRKTRPCDHNFAALPRLPILGIKKLSLS